MQIGNNKSNIYNNISLTCQKTKLNKELTSNSY